MHCLSLLLPLAIIGSVAAVDLRSSKPLDCSQPLRLGDYAYDLSSLSEIVSTESISTPPSTTRISLAINLCSPLSSSGPAQDSCPANSRICLKMSNTKSGSSEESLNQIVPLHTSDYGFEVETSNSGSGDKLEWTFYGPQYGNRKQKVEIEMICDNKIKDERPKFRSYDLLEGEAKIYWRSQYACPSTKKGSDSTSPSDGGSNQDTTKSSSGWSLFTWLIIFAILGLIAYFIIGTYTNHQRYGTYEIPHRDFWREAPYLVQDAGRHAWKSVSGQGSGGRGAYEPL
ncbi:unnamed protein product [Sympodiomycopsis kandeliae]